MYEAFFELNMKPFELVPNPDMLFPSRAHRKALSFLEYGFNEGAGFILLTGEVGSGKTTLIRNLIHGLDCNTTRAMIFNTLVRPRQLLAMINDEFGLEVAGKDKVTLLRELNDFLVEQYARTCRSMLIIDEAQNLSMQSLEEIRLLSNLELDAGKLLQIILVGQPELKELVAQPGLRQLRQRISINCHLSTLDREETEAYVYHRLERAGNRNAAQFAAGTFDIIHDYSGGVPRLINIYCDFILLAAFVEGTRELSQELVREVVSELAIPPSASVAAATPQALVNELESRLVRLEAGQVEAASLKNDHASINNRLGNHENIIRKVVKAQQNQIKHLDQRLEEINTKLEALIGEHYRINERSGPVPVQVVEPGCVTSRFWHSTERNS